MVPDHRSVIAEPDRAILATVENLMITMARLGGGARGKPMRDDADAACGHNKKYFTARARTGRLPGSFRRGGNPGCRERFRPCSEAVEIADRWALSGSLTVPRALQFVSL